ncbi:MAG: hypothetical protein R8M38_05850 [Mariprofundaceae bacterium]
MMEESIMPISPGFPTKPLDHQGRQQDAKKEPDQQDAKEDKTVVKKRDTKEKTTPSLDQEESPGIDRYA